MLGHFNAGSSPLMRLAISIVAGALALAVVSSLPPPITSRAQEAAADSATARPSLGENSPTKRPAINIFELAKAGGIFMIPIAGMSLLALTITFDRLLALRRGRVVPTRLVRSLRQLADSGFEAREALRLCQRFPSAAANVIAAMLARVGRPLSEMEMAGSATSQREADKLYGNVRWLSAAASLATMLGLIGTIQGMIMAFHRLTTMEAGADRTTALAAGIYTALVTTFAGLAVAIPALFAAHYFEGRILKLFREIDQLVSDLSPEFERFENTGPKLARSGNGESASPAGQSPVSPSPLSQPR
jgi:biopolymer transport protein ExbB